MSGFVSLVGAGPGDPALLTRRATARLRSADLVLFDALIDDRVLGLARRARRFYVGKRAGRHSTTQDTINRLMIRAAGRGQRVVRLKGGDPFVFGRGGEEALALMAAGIDFEVVPGVTSATAAPAAAGIPVTHRGIASGFIVLQAHDEASFEAMVTALPPNVLTLVILMGIRRRTAIVDLLASHHWRRDTPAAVISAAWSDHETIWRGTLGDLPHAFIDAGEAGTIVIGTVAGLDLRAAARHESSAVADEPPASLAAGGQYVSR